MGAWCALRILFNRGQTLVRESTRGVSKVHLLGVHHLSELSCQDASTLVKFLKPDVLFLEICPDRLGLLNDPRSEFRAAAVMARRVGVKKIVLGDQDIKITDDMYDKRAEEWRKMDPNISEDAVEDLVTREIYIMHRDMYMAYELEKLSETHSSILAIVGRAHLKGIKHHWESLTGEVQHSVFNYFFGGLIKFPKTFGFEDFD